MCADALPNAAAESVIGTRSASAMCVNRCIDVWRNVGSYGLYTGGLWSVNLDPQARRGPETLYQRAPFLTGTVPDGVPAS